LYLFVFLWVLALFFDICDGIVARATDQKSAVGSFYDHFTDVIKILVLYALIAVKYDSSEIWMLSTANIIAFSLLGFSNMVLSQRNAILRRETRKEEKGRSKTENVSSGKERLLVFMDKIPFLKNTFLFVYTSIFVMYGNFNLLLIPLAINPLAARITFLVVLVVVIKSLLGIIWSVHKLNIYMDENKISWK
jgi:phosphatidylglycerophosphate synthase